MPIPPRHARFLLALAVGVAVGLACAPMGLAVDACMLIGMDAGFATYLALMWHFAHRTDAEGLARLASDADEGTALMLLIAALAVVTGLLTIFRTLGAAGDTPLPTGIAALLAVPLGWATLQVMAAFHYARMFYRGAEGSGGLTFPETEKPGPVDFLYFAFGVAMTAQVADVAVTTPALRKVVLVHSTASFFFNTVILALAVNAAVSIGQG